MRVAHLSYKDARGGAAIAASRIVDAARGCGVDAQLLTSRRFSEHAWVSSPANIGFRVGRVCRPMFAYAVNRLMASDNPVFRSPAVLPSSWPRRINAGNFDLSHLHWVGREHLSVPDVTLLSTPLIWTLHDMWPFCGAEHYANDDRWRVGYRRDNRSAGEMGLDINRVVWERKKRLWTHPIQLVAPSQWMANCAIESALMGEWPVQVIPNPIDVNAWQPKNKVESRRLLGLPESGTIILFGAIGGHRDARKGFSVLRSALAALQLDHPDLSVAVFGQRQPRQRQGRLGLDDVPVHYLGTLKDVGMLSSAYAACDIHVCPAQLEAFGQTALEAHACGRSVVAFQGTGIADIVEHQRTGYLAKHGDASDLAHGMGWLLEQLSKPDSKAAIQQRARDRAVARFATGVIGQQYVNLYERVASGSRGRRN